VARPSLRLLTRGGLLGRSGLLEVPHCRLLIGGCLDGLCPCRGRVLGSLRLGATGGFRSGLQARQCRRLRLLTGRLLSGLRLGAASGFRLGLLLACQCRRLRLSADGRLLIGLNLSRPLSVGLRLGLTSRLGTHKRDSGLGRTVIQAPKRGALEWLRSFG